MTYEKRVLDTLFLNYMELEQTKKEALANFLL